MNGYLSNGLWTAPVTGLYKVRPDLYKSLYFFQVYFFAGVRLCSSSRRFPRRLYNQSKRDHRNRRPRNRWRSGRIRNCLHLPMSLVQTYNFWFSLKNTRNFILRSSHGICSLVKMESNQTLSVNLRSGASFDCVELTSWPYTKLDILLIKPLMNDIVVFGWKVHPSKIHPLMLHL